MSHWNHRVIRRAYPDGKPSVSGALASYGVHEAYYDDAGNVDGWTAEPVAPFGETPDELKYDLLRHLEAFAKPILDEAAEMDRMEKAKQ